VGVHRTYMGLVERGGSVVTILTAQKIARGLGLSLAAFIERVESRLSRA